MSFICFPFLFSSAFVSHFIFPPFFSVFCSHFVVLHFLTFYYFFTFIFRTFLPPSLNTLHFLPSFFIFLSSEPSLITLYSLTLLFLHSLFVSHLFLSLFFLNPLFFHPLLHPFPGVKGREKGNQERTADVPDPK